MNVCGFFCCFLMYFLFKSCYFSLIYFLILKAVISSPCIEHCQRRKKVVYSHVRSKLNPSFWYRFRRLLTKPLIGFIAMCEMVLAILQSRCCWRWCFCVKKTTLFKKTCFIGFVVAVVNENVSFSRSPCSPHLRRRQAKRKSGKNEEMGRAYR